MSDNEHLDQIERLLRLAGPREAVPAERAERVKTAVRAEWRRQAQARSRRLTIGWSVGALATAAVLLLAVRVARNEPPPAGAAPVVATLETLNGIRAGERIAAGGTVETPAGGNAAVRLAGGAWVRVDAGTRLQFVSDVALVLDSGGIYVDSGADGDTGGLEVRTRFGIARDIGTRFEVRVDAAAVRVRVRDGLVRLVRGVQSHEAQPGDELRLDGDGRVARREVPLYGADWAWIAASVAPFDIEGQFLRHFLDWICAENGWQLRFADPEIERRAATTTLKGSIRGFTAEEALAAVLPTVGVEHQLRDGVLLIRLGRVDEK